MKFLNWRGAPLSRRNARVWALRLRKTAIVLAVVAVVGGAGYYGWTRLPFKVVSEWASAKTLSTTASAGFRVNEILVTGRRRISQDDLLAKLDVHYGDPIFGVDVEAVRDTLAEVSWVKEVSVTRRLPDKIVVQLKERAPAALWQYQKKISLIDEGGRTLASRDLGEFQSLPLVVGEDAPEHAAALLKLLAAEPDVMKQLQSAVRVGARRWDLRLKNGINVKLPETEAELALARLAVETDGLLTKNIVTIDLRLPEQITVQPGPTPVAEDKKTI